MNANEATTAAAAFHKNKREIERCRVEERKQKELKTAQEWWSAFQPELEGKIRVASSKGGCSVRFDLDIDWHLDTQRDFIKSFCKAGGFRVWFLQYAGMVHPDAIIEWRKGEGV